MDSDQRFWLGLWLIIGLVIVAATVAVCLTIRLNTRDYIRGGYTVESLPGQELPHWVKK